MATYEWALERQGELVANSDCGHGIKEHALRDGLIVALGAPAADAVAEHDRLANRNSS